MKARNDAIRRLREQGYTSKVAQAIVDYFGPASSGEYVTAHIRAVDRLIRIHRRDYNRFLAQERGHIPGSAEIDDREFDLPGDEPPDPPDEK